MLIFTFIDRKERLWKFEALSVAGAINKVIAKCDLSYEPYNQIKTEIVVDRRFYHPVVGILASRWTGSKF